MRKSLLILFCILLSFSSLYAQEENPRVAVLPFNNIGTSKADAQVVTGLFETALVKAGVYNVIEQNQVEDILEAQAHSLGGCTDEACAIEFGKLLSAEQIILGTLSTLGASYILNAKIIDITLGKNIKAEKVSADSLESMADAAELLAFKLAGLTFSTGGEDIIAREFGEVFVETDPPGAAIYVNGVRKGVSPDLISRVPIGRVVIEARTEGLYGREEVNLEGATEKITIALSEVRGNIFIATSEKNIELYIDGELYGDPGSGFIEAIPVGERRLELKGSDVYWEDTVSVLPDETVKVEATLRPFGSLEYDLPEDAFCEVKSPVYREIVRGNGVLSPLWVGEYTLTVDGDNYQVLEDRISVERGGTVIFKPEVEFTEEYRNTVAIAERLEELKSRRSELEAEVLKLDRQYRIKKTTPWVLLGTGAVGLISSGVFYFLGEAAYDNYLLATTEDSVLSYRRQVDLYDTLVYAAGGAGALCTSGWAALFMMPSGDEILERKEPVAEELEGIEEEIASIEEVLAEKEESK